MLVLVVVLLRNAHTFLSKSLSGRCSGPAASEAADAVGVAAAAASLSDERHVRAANEWDARFFNARSARLQQKICICHR